MAFLNGTGRAHLSIRPGGMKGYVREKTSLSMSTVTLLVKLKPGSIFLQCDAVWSYEELNYC